MQCISFVTRDLITKEKLEEILKLAGFKYELGGYKPYANFGVPDRKNKAILVIDINEVDEYGDSQSEKEALREFKNADMELPIVNGHILDVEYDNYRVLDAFEKAIKELYTEVFYYDDILNKFIKL